MELLREHQRSWRPTAAGREITGIPNAPASDAADATIFKIALK